MSVRTRFGRNIAILFLLAVAMLAQVPGAVAQQVMVPSARTSLDPFRLSLDQSEAAIARDGLSLQSLTDLRGAIARVRDELRGRSAEIEPHLAQADQRLKEIGPAPAKDAPPESASISAEREQLNRTYSDLDAVYKQVKLLSLRADQMLERINERRRMIFARALLERTSSVLDPLLWIEAARAIPGDVRGISFLLRSWWGYAADNVGAPRIAIAFAMLAGLAFVAVMFARWWRSRHAAIEMANPAQLGKVLIGTRVLLETTVAVPIVMIAILVTLNTFDLLPELIVQVNRGLLVAVLTASFGHGVARGLFSIGRPEYRLFTLDDVAARTLHMHLVWAARAFGATIFLNVLHKATVAPVAITIATNALLAFVIGGLILHLLLRLRVVSGEAPAEASRPGQWLRVVGWVAVTVIAVALLTGYIGLAAFAAERALAVVAVLGAAYLLLALLDTAFEHWLRADSLRARSIAASLGVQPRSLELIGTIFSALVRLLLIAFAAFVALAPRGMFASEVFGAMQDAVFAFQIGEITVSLTAIFGAAAVLLIGLLITRAVQGWLSTRFLPRTALDQSLQLSISTVFGYVGFIAAIALSLAELGIDLQKIALVAGALSVGIGFGLQSIVSNFVSGLILLAERPIRVGDSIVVKGEEGYVRRISVRATEIETFERATVIIPNSELISGVVKNWTHANTLSRIIIKVGVAYDSDPQVVHDLLLACADEHPQVMVSPVPRVLFAAFGDNALEFELRCVVSNVDYALIVKSDLNFAILRAFRQAGIAIPNPQRDIHVFLKDDLTQALPKPGKRKTQPET
ncbi:MAG TPA: DUF3772 domain-containing protein [Xanthobacteraceae bacterium]|nr:DUF3772 domain-containing protein [Xanthobacteraceae bacterium]